MIINSKRDFIEKVKSFNINTEYVVVKPNWVSNEFGEYTESEILEWLFQSLPKTKKIVIESYTPWRGLKFDKEIDTYEGPEVSLTEGYKEWDYYKKQDKFFLETTGTGMVLEKYNAEYINITNEFWAKKCADSSLIKQLVNQKIKWEEFYGYIPQKLVEIKDKSTLISLSKIKIENFLPTIAISMSIKNLFGLIPHPSRYTPFHQDNHKNVPEAIRDIYVVYTSLFKNNLWITEGIKTYVQNYCEPEQVIVKNSNVFFIGREALKVDSEACIEVGVNPKKVEQLTILP